MIQSEPLSPDLLIFGHAEEFLEKFKGKVDDSKIFPYKNDCVMRNYEGMKCDREKLCDFIEVVGIKMDIIDERLYKSFLFLEEEQKEKLKSLGVKVMEEKVLEREEVLFAKFL